MKKTRKVFNDYYELVRHLEIKRVPYDKAVQVARKANYGLYWHEAPKDRVEGYHSRPNGHPYSLKKHLQGLDSTLKFGVELEVELTNPHAAASTDAFQYAPSIYALAQHTIGDGLIRLERDGSLSNGVEIIFAPLSQRQWQGMYSKLYKFLRGLNKFGFTSHTNGHCGLHVHITKSQACAIERLEKYLLVKHTQFWSKISRRENFSYCKLQKQQYRDDRYVALNKSPQYTDEVRLFRGTLKPATFFASLEAVFALASFANDPQVKRASWNRFVKHAQSYRMLSRYVAEKMNNDWGYIVRTRRKLTEEEKQARASIKRMSMAERQALLFKNRQARIDNLLSDIHSYSERAYLWHRDDDSYATKPCEIVMNRLPQRDRKLIEGVVTPITFREVNASELERRFHRPTIRVYRTHGWGRTRTSANFSSTAVAPY